MIRQPRPCSAPTTPHTKSAATIMPVVAPTFKGTGLETEILELVQQLTPTAECERAVAHLTRGIKKALLTTFPDAEVNGFVSANLDSGKAFGVAVPEVNIVATISQQAVQKRSASQRTWRGKAAQEDLEPRQLQKYAIRTCTEKLVQAMGLRFRRTAFRGEDPKVTLLAPANMGLCKAGVSVPLDFSVNAAVPMQNAAIFSECGKLDQRAQALILLVRRWAKDRGICHAAKGNLSPYAWTLLAVYFLQVGSDESVLPALQDMEAFAHLAKGRSGVKPSPVGLANVSVAHLFTQFFNFFSEFDWHREGVVVRVGHRATPAVTTLGSTVALNIEDPFHGANLGSGMNLVSFSRLQEELKRAKDLFVAGESLSVLLEPWAPATPEAEGGDAQ